MFWDQLLHGVKNYYMDDIYLISLFVGMMSLFDLILKRKYNLIKTFLGLVCISLFLYLTFRLLHAVQYTIFYTYQGYFESHPLAYDIFYNFGIWMFFVQVIWLIIGARWLYTENIWVCVFSAVSFYMFLSLIADYIMPLTLVALDPRVGESGYYYNFEIGGGVFYPLIGVITALILYYVFRIWIRSYFKVVISLPLKQMKKMTVIPIFACITYNIIYLLMSYVNVYPSAPDGLVYFVFIFGTIIGVYAMMFLALFFGILSAIKTTKVKAELDIAADIQNANLPDKTSELECADKVDIIAQMTPVWEVGGDFYDYFMIDHNHLAIVIADVSGKGIAAALFMMMAKALIKNSAYDCSNPGEIFMRVNKQLKEDNKSKMFITAFMGILDLQSGVLTYTNAGHNYPIIKKYNGNYKKFVMKNDFVITGMKNIQYHTYETRLETGDEIFLYTDGVTEAMNDEGKLFGYERLEEALNSDTIKNSSIYDKMVYVQTLIDKFKKQDFQSDDITMLFMRYKGDKEALAV